MRTSAAFALTLHCGHLPPFPRLCRSSHDEMHRWPKQCPQASAQTWCGPPRAHGSRQMLHASVSPGAIEAAPEEGAGASPGAGATRGEGPADADDARATDASSASASPGIPGSVEGGRDARVQNAPTRLSSWLRSRKSS